MLELFKDILDIEGVKGAMLFSPKGEITFKHFNSDVSLDPEKMNWKRFIELLDNMRETDLIFEKGRLYIRKTDAGHLIIFMSLFVPMAILRLNCDILLPALTPEKSSNPVSWRSWTGLRLNCDILRPSLAPVKSSKRWSRFFKR